jgi:hypothetical protein
MLWGAGLACALGGAVAGNALGSTPILDRPAIGSFYQVHDSAEPLSPSRERLPDHYPLVTKNGTVPVGELSMRGLYSQKRYRSYLARADYAPEELRYAEYRPGEEWRDAATRAALASGDPPVGHEPEQARDETENAAAPLQLAAGPASIEGGGQARLMDVNAALAMR